MDDSTAPVEPGVSAILRRLVSIWQNPIVRLTLSVPAVLSVLANLDDIGSIAEWLVKFWAPVQAFVVQTLKPVRALFPNVDLEAAALVVFLAPIAIGGAVVKRGVPTKDKPWVYVVGAIWLAGAAVVIVGSNPGRNIASILLMLGYLFLMRNRIFGQSIRFVWANIILLLVWGVVLGAFTGSFVGPVLLSTVLTIGAFAPRRLVEIGICVVSIVAISVLHQFIDRQVGLPQ